MDVVKHVSLTRLAAADVGELLLLNLNEEKGVGIFMERVDKTSKIALISGHASKWPELLLMQDPQEACGSFGRDWIIEPLPGDESIPYGADRALQMYGALFMGAADMPVIRLGPSTAHNKVHEFSPRDCAAWKVEKEAIPYFNWRVWKDLEAYLEGDEDRGLICEVTAAAPQPS